MIHCFLYLQKEGAVIGGIPKSGQGNDCVIPVDDNLHFIARLNTKFRLYFFSPECLEMKEIKNQITLNSFFT